MQVGIEYTLAARHAPGPGRYVRELVRALVQLADRPEISLFEGGRSPRILGAAALGLDGAEGVRRRSVRLPRRLIEAGCGIGFGLDRWLEGIDVLHHAQLSKLRSTRVREVIPAAEFPASSDLERVRNAWRVLVFSRFMAAALADRGVDPDRIAVVPVGADHWARELVAAPPRDVPPVIAVLGAVRATRYQHVVLAACERLRARGLEVTLDLLGRAPASDAPFVAAAARSPMRDAISISTPSEPEIPARLARASVLVHLEDAPGTPVTPLEALSLGVPVVCNRADAFVEALDGAARFVDEFADPAVLADVIAAAIERRDEGVERRRATAAPFTWAANARATVEVWRQGAPAASSSGR